jgi:hypothetical protein
VPKILQVQNVSNEKQHYRLPKTLVEVEETAAVNGIDSPPKQA